MRFFFWGLLIVNMGYLAWELSKNEPPFSASPGGHIVGEKIKLFSEVQSPAAGLTKAKKHAKQADLAKQKKIVPAAKKIGVARDVQKENKATSTVKTPKELLPNCYSVGLFAKKEEMSSVQKKLRKLAIKSEVKEERTSQNRYWVFLPSYPSLKDAQDASKDLKVKGIRDYQILVSPGKKYAISLGVFSRKAIAKSRVDSVKKYGYSPEIEVMSRERVRYRIDFQVSAVRKLPKILADKKNNIKIEKISCK